MCGIVGYIGEQPTKDFIIDGLKTRVQEAMTQLVPFCLILKVT